VDELECGFPDNMPSRKWRSDLETTPMPQVFCDWAKDSEDVDRLTVDDTGGELLVSE